MTKRNVHSASKYALRARVLQSLLEKRGVQMDELDETNFMIECVRGTTQKPVRRRSSNVIHTDFTQQLTGTPNYHVIVGSHARIAAPHHTVGEWCQLVLDFLASKGGAATRRQMVDELVTSTGIRLTAADKEIQSNNRPRWVNSIDWAKTYLKGQGAIFSSDGMWRLSGNVE